MCGKQRYYDNDKEAWYIHDTTVKHAKFRRAAGEKIY